MAPPDSGAGLILPSSTAMGRQIIEAATSGHTGLFGQTGSGKSWAEHRIMDGLPIRRWKIIIDPKGGMHKDGRRPWPLLRMVRTDKWSEVRALLDRRPTDAQPTILYQPRGLAAVDPRLYEAILADIWGWVLTRKDRTGHRWEWPGAHLLLDEIGGFATANSAPAGLRVIWQQGRQCDVFGIAGMQRPADVPIGLISESRLKLIWWLERYADYRTVWEATGRRHPKLLTSAREDAGATSPRDPNWWAAWMVSDGLCRPIRFT